MAAKRLSSWAMADGEPSRAARLGPLRKLPNPTAAEIAALTALIADMTGLGSGGKRGSISACHVWDPATGRRLVGDAAATAFARGNYVAVITFKDDETAMRAIESFKMAPQALRARLASEFGCPSLTDGAAPVEPTLEFLSDAWMAIAHPVRKVRVRVFVTRLVDIDLKAQTFTAKMQLEASWVEPKLMAAGAAAGAAGGAEPRADNERSRPSEGVLFIEGSDEPFYAPRLHLANLIAEEHSEGWFRVYAGPEDATPVVCFRMALQGTFQETMRLRRFPYDSQQLAIELRTGWELTDAYGVPRPDGDSTLLERNRSAKYVSRVQTVGFILASEYALHSRVVLEEGETDPWDSAELCRYSVLRAKLRVDRRAGFVHLNIALPLFLITSCVFTSYIVPPEAFADRAAINLTLLLAQVAFKFIVSDKLPAISYATLVDAYVLLSFLATFGVMLHQSVVSAAALGETPVAPGLEISGTAVALGAVWLGVHALVVLATACAPRRRRANEWTARGDALWLGPLREDVVASAQPAALTPAIIREVAELGRVPVDSVRACRVWAPAEGARCVGAKDEWEGSSPFAILVLTDQETAQQAAMRFGLAGHTAAAHTRLREAVGTTEPLKLEVLYAPWAALARETLKHGQGAAAAVTSAAAAVQPQP